MAFLNKKIGAKWSPTPNVGLLYSFVAVNIIADIFMCSIDAISSKTKIVKTMGPDGKEESVEVYMISDDNKQHKGLAP